MKIFFLGTSSATVSADRDNTSILVRNGNDLILLDCSGNPAGKLLKLGEDPNDLDLVLLTHLHIDHCYGLPTLLFHMFLNGRTQSITIGCPEEEFDNLDQQLLSHGISQDVRTFDLIRTPVPPKSVTVFESEDSRITAVPGQHSRPNRAYRIDNLHTGKSVVFTGDSRPDDGIIALSKSADILIHESTYLDVHKDLAADYGHSTAREAGQVAAAADAETLVLIHFEVEPGSSADCYRHEASKTFSGRILTPGDLDTITL